VELISHRASINNARAFTNYYFNHVPPQPRTTQTARTEGYPSCAAQNDLSSSIKLLILDFPMRSIQKPNKQRLGLISLILMWLSLRNHARSAPCGICFWVVSLNLDSSGRGTHKKLRNAYT
jgi:hypothetical protein